MTSRGFACFETALGVCGLAWSDDGVTRIRLPATDGSADTMRGMMARAVPGVPEAAPPPVISDAIERIVRHLRREPAALEDIVLDMADVPDFYREVYVLARRIPPGETRSYGELANVLGKPGAARAIGQAMGKNPFAIVMPCHRVLSARQGTGGFSAPGGVQTKARLLALEGVALHVQRELPLG